MKNKKIYEVPALFVTELETEDIMAQSALMGWDLIQSGEILANGEIDYGALIESDMLQ